MAGDVVAYTSKQGADLAHGNAVALPHHRLRVHLLLLHVLCYRNLEVASSRRLYVLPLATVLPAPYLHPRSCFVVAQTMHQNPLSADEERDTEK